MIGRLNVCGLPYRIEVTTAEDAPELTDCDGYTSPSKGVIFLRAGMPAQRMRDTLVHEVMHAFLEATGLAAFLEHSLRPGVDAESFEETLIRLTVPSLLRFLDDNGDALLDAAGPQSGVNERAA